MERAPVICLNVLVKFENVAYFNYHSLDCCLFPFQFPGQISSHAGCQGSGGEHFVGEAGFQKWNGNTFTQV